MAPKPNSTNSIIAQLQTVSTATQRPNTISSKSKLENIPSTSETVTNIDVSTLTSSKTSTNSTATDKSVYNPVVDPCHPSYDASQVDTSKIIPNYGTKNQHRFYIFVSYILNWLPFLIVFDCVIGLFWCPNDRYYTTQWGILKILWLKQPTFFTELLAYYIVTVTFLSLILYYMHSKNNYSNQYLIENIINKPDNQHNTSKILTDINRLYPSTTRVIHNNSNNNNTGSDIIIIGTSHLSESSGKQVNQLIEVLNDLNNQKTLTASDSKSTKNTHTDTNTNTNAVSSVVLELDELRYLRMRMGDANPNLYNATLARDIFKLRTYLDPITFFARIGTHLTAYFVEPGMEFRYAANMAIKKNINIVYGDQELEKTVESISKNTPKWLVLLLNIFILTSYGFPILSAFSHVYFVLNNDTFINIFTKIFVTYIVWNVIYYPIYLLIRVFTEQSKLGNGMKRISCLLKTIAKIMPCLAKVFKKSDFKTVRDETLAIRTVNTSKKYKKGTIVIAVVGLAHMNDMANIINNELRNYNNVCHTYNNTSNNNENRNNTNECNNDCNDNSNDCNICDNSQTNDCDNTVVI